MPPRTGDVPPWTDPQRAAARVLLAFADWRLGPEQVAAVVADEAARLHHHVGTLLVESARWGVPITLVTSDLRAAVDSTRPLIVLAAPHRHRVLDVAEAIAGIVALERRAKVLLATTRRQFVRDVQRMLPVPVRLLDVDELAEPDLLGPLDEP